MMRKHKILALLLALVASIGLWFYVVTVVNPNDKTRISGVKVRIVGTSELMNSGLILTGGEDQTVDVEISGRRSDLKELNSSSLEAIADVSNIDRAGLYEVSWTLDPPSTVASGDIKLVNTNSNKVKVKISEYNERPAIPVEVEYIGEPAENYIRSDATLSVETLSVSGPAEEVTDIVKAVVTVDLADVQENVSVDAQYRFLDGQGQELTMSQYVTVSEPTVRVSVPVQRYKQVTLKVKMTAGGGATDKDTECEITPPTIIVTGSDEAIEKMPDELEILTINLEDVTEATDWTIKPDLPVGVTNRASETSVKISLHFKGLKTKSFTVPCAEIERINDVTTLAFAEQSVVIQVRGKVAAVDALKLSDVRVIADMTNSYDPTTKRLTLRVTLPSSTTAGVIGGPYTVSMTEVVPETE